MNTPTTGDQVPSVEKTQHGQEEKMTDQEMQEMTKEEVQRFLADRKEAGKKIDLENCEVFGGHGNWFDPYNVRESSEFSYGKHLFVRSPKSDGWVHEREPATGHLYGPAQGLARSFETARKRP
jgi:hypothetical protein